VVDAQEAVRPVLHEADVTVATDREAQVVAVAPGIAHAEHVAHWCVLEASDAAQLLADDTGLQPELLAVVDVLELTAAAAAEVLALRVDATR
jgi:hypothetical protein